MKSYEEKCREKHEEYEKYYSEPPFPLKETQWMAKDILLNLLNQKGRYYIEIGFKPNGTVVWRESTKSR
jgi:hypothetical protein